MSEQGGNFSVKCPTCGGDSSVMETRRAPYGTRRRRKCEAARVPACPLFTTAELCVPWPDGVMANGAVLVRSDDIVSLFDALTRLTGKGW